MKQIERYLFIVLGCLVSASSINTFYVPSNLLTGGVTGIAMIVHFLWGLPIGIQTFVYNLPLLIAAYVLMGKKYFCDVIIGTVIFSICLDLTRSFSSLHLVDDVMLASIFGGVFCGIGYGIVFRNSGSTGGFDIVGAIVKKYYSFDMGAAIFSFNCMIMVFAALLFGVPVALFTLIGMYMSAHITDKVIAGINHRKAVLIVSNMAEEIADSIINEVGRGVTFLHGQGAYTLQERDVVFVVVKMTQVAKIKNIVNQIDEGAFMIILAANEVMGRGFTLPGIDIEKLRQGRLANKKKVMKE